MAVMTRVKARPVPPVGYEVNDKGQAKVSIVAGDLLIMTADAPSNGYERVWDKAATGTAEAHGIALMDAVAGQIVSVGIHGEMDGWTGLVPGTALYPSGTTAAALDDTARTIATTPAVPLPVRIRATTTTRIRYGFN
jgi:hypothetical protein